MRKTSMILKIPKKNDLGKKILSSYLLLSFVLSEKYFLHHHNSKFKYLMILFKIKSNKTRLIRHYSRPTSIPH